MKKENDKKRSALYIRVSSLQQKKGYSPEVQLEDCKKAIVERDGCTVKPEHIFDDSKSAKNDERPNWQALIEVAKRGEIDFIYFWKLDRMMRSERHFYKNEELLEKLGIELRFATQDLSDPFNRAIQVAVAADELRKITERTFQGRIRALRHGKWVARAPYGYRIDDDTKKLKINKKEAEYVRQLFKWFVDEKLSLTALGRKLKLHKVPTRYDREGKKKSRNGYGFWSKGSLGRMLNREYYATGEAWFHKYKNPDLKRFGSAELRPEEDWIKVPISPIISMELYEKAQERLDKNREFSRRKTKKDYLFAKKLYCETCGLKLTAGCRPNRELAKYYRGETWSEKRCAECRYYVEQYLDIPIWDSLLNFLRNPDVFIAELEKYQSRDSRKQDIEKEQEVLREFEEKIHNQDRALLKYRLEGFHSEEILNEMKEGLEAERKVTERRKNELEKMCLMEERRADNVVSAKRLYLKIRDKVKDPSYSIRKKVYDLLLEKIVLNGQQARVWVHLPTGVMSPQLLRLTPYEE